MEGKVFCPMHYRRRYLQSIYIAERMLTLSPIHARALSNSCSLFRTDVNYLRNITGILLTF